jgi:hypothetical protein
MNKNPVNTAEHKPISADSEKRLDILSFSKASFNSKIKEPAILGIANIKENLTLSFLGNESILQAVMHIPSLLTPGNTAIVWKRPTINDFISEIRPLLFCFSEANILSKTNKQQPKTMQAPAIMPTELNPFITFFAKTAKRTTGIVPKKSCKKKVSFIFLDFEKNEEHISFTS